MSKEWTAYARTDFDAGNPPGPAEITLVPVAQLSAPDSRALLDKIDYLGQDFPPGCRYVMYLRKSWREHPVGARVLIEAFEVAIESTTN